MTAPGTVRVEGATFLMGSDRGYPEEAPAHRVAVEGFWIDTHEVTNSRFAAFVEDTGHRTVAERPPQGPGLDGVPAELLVPGSLVFVPPPGPVPLTDPGGWWHWVPGASWRHPEGPRSDVVGREDHPVVHVAWEDVVAYAAWAGGRLPTEAEWELAARGGLDGAEFAWGDELTPGGRWMANTWQGEFPWRNTADDGFAGTAPVGSFPANPFGLHDMIGNVWEWTSDRFAPHADASGDACCSGARTVPGVSASEPEQRVIKGGSHLCAASYCRRYRPAARSGQDVDTSSSHLGFRLVRSA